ncbi:hypothetical protein [Peribacillus tepidiphilus]|uniref:hypothetical protein n=1 Tax=Peribacillus tepidiphilus TaxID=2652445 RepID=UPI0035B5207E
MFSQFFGHYLLNRGLINADQLKDALELQQSTHVKLGVLAVNEGFMTSSQVEAVHEKQKQVDKRFGELAVELSYLTEEQVEKMLSTQKHHHLQLAQALVDREYMTIDAFSQALATYKKEYGLSDEKFEAIKSGDIEALVDSLLTVSSEEQKTYFTDYLSLFAKNMIRFIDGQLHFEISPLKGVLEAKYYVSQEITGEKPLYTAIAADEKTFLAMASAYAEEELTEMDEMAAASVSEFLNLHNGIFLVNMSNIGIELEMKPQQFKEKVEITGTDTSYVVTVYTSKGSFKLMLCDTPEKFPRLRELTRSTEM